MAGTITSFRCGNKHTAKPTCFDGPLATTAVPLTGASRDNTNSRFTTLWCKSLLFAAHLLLVFVFFACIGSPVGAAMYSRTATLPRPRTAAPGNLRRCVGGAALGSTASAVLAIAASAARRGLVIDSAFVSKHDRLRNGDAPLTKHADKYVLRPLKFRPIDPRTGAPVPAEADPSQQQPSGIDRLDRGLPLESRRVVAEVHH